MPNILPAEYFGLAQVTDDYLDVGGLRIKMDWRGCSNVPVFVRRNSDDLSVAEVILAHHDGYAQEELDAQNAEANRYPLGKKEYWRTQMVGKYTDGKGHPMTDEQFEEWYSEPNTDA
jgi:hypothetical protein